MGFSIAFTAFAFIILCSTSSIEAIDGYIAPLIHRTSPKHPLYNPNTTLEDLVEERIRISEERMRYFARQRLAFGRLNGVPPGVAPISLDVLMTYSIGTPPVEAIAVPDTGSHLIWQQCQPCSQCYKQKNPIFDPRRSSTYQLVSCMSEFCTTKNGFSCASRRSKCIYEIEYADGSRSIGDVGTDSLTLPGNEYYLEVTVANTVFGCGTFNQLTYSRDPSGIVGLQNTSISLVNQFGGDSFSYCISGKGGFIYFGKIAKLSGSSTTLFTDSFDTYQVNLIDIAVGSTPQSSSRLNVPSKIFKMVKDSPYTGTTVDSGTAYTHLPPSVLRALIRRTGELLPKYKSVTTSKPYRICYYTDRVDPGFSVETMPSVSLVFDKMTLLLPNKNVWSKKSRAGYICLKILESPPPGRTYTVIGEEQLKDFNLGYDLRENLIWFNYNPGCV